MDMAISPDSWTGDMPLNALVTLDCHNRPYQLPFINATNEAKQSHDDDQIVMPCKCPAAFEWKANRGWNAEERLQQRIHLEASKDPHLWDGPLGQKVQACKDDLEGTWEMRRKGSKHSGIASRTMLPLFLKKKRSSFDGCAFHTGRNSDKRETSLSIFTLLLPTAVNLEGMDESTGISGLYSASGYDTSDPTLDTWADMKMDYIYEQPPISRSVYKRSENDYKKFMKSVVHFVAMMMLDYQL